MKKIAAIFFLAISFLTINAQNRNNIWCFGDSAGIDFSNPQNPVTIHSAVNSRGSCVSIADANSNLLFYAYTRASVLGNTTYVKDKNNNIMLNGTNIVGEGWYNELVIIPIPDDTLQYYLFTIGVTGSSSSGLYYSTIDMSYNNGLGKVTSNNNQLLPDPANDGLTAVKHGNGRDWWLIHRKCGLCSGGGGHDNTFYKYLITPSGIQGPFIQNIGTVLSTGTHKYIFNLDGSKLAMVQWEGLTEIFDFDRCNGILANPIILHPPITTSPTSGFVNCEFSPSGQYLYIATNGYLAPAYLIQVDLQNPLGYAAADTIDSLTVIPDAGGYLKRAPDNKIYWSCIYNNNFNFPYPYADSMYNMYNMNLSVINAPDSPGTACNFTPYSFYLGGNRTYWGLPNNPNYDLPRLQGSPCDTVLWTGVAPLSKGEGSGLRLYPNPCSNYFYINYDIPTNKNLLFVLYDSFGKEVLRKTLYGTAKHLLISTSGLSDGVYYGVSSSETSQGIYKETVKVVVIK